MKTQRLSAGVLPPLALVLTACGTAAAAPESTPLPAVSAAGPDATLPPETAKTLAEGHKILVAYFTRAENITVDPAVDAVASASINLDGETVMGTIPQAVCSFLEEYDFSGKTIIPFASHEGSNLCFWIFPDL